MIPGPNWSRRYGSQPRRLCARPGCGTQAAATLRFLPTRREAWLVDLDQEVARTEGDLCARHAGALVLPRGWELHDERTHDPAVAEPEAEAPRERPARAARTRRARVKREAPPTLPGISAADPAGSEPTHHAEPLAPVATVVEVLDTDAPPDADPDDAAPRRLAKALDARTPLLRRAFGNVTIPGEAG